MPGLTEGFPPPARLPLPSRLSWMEMLVSSVWRLILERRAFIAIIESKRPGKNKPQSQCCRSRGNEAHTSKQIERVRASLRRLLQKLVRRHGQFLFEFDNVLLNVVRLWRGRPGLFPSARESEAR